MSVTLKPRESALDNLEDVFEGEECIGWIAPAVHGRYGRDWWMYQSKDGPMKTAKGKDAAVKALQKARNGQ